MPQFCRWFGAQDFNGELLQTVLLALPHGAIAKVALLFLQDWSFCGVLMLAKFPYLECIACCITLSGLGTGNCIFNASSLFVTVTTCESVTCCEEGRHAGPGGDIEQIVAGAMEKRPDLSIRTTAVLAGRVLHGAFRVAVRRCWNMGLKEWTLARSLISGLWTDDSEGLNKQVLVCSRNQPTHKVLLTIL